MATRTKKAKHIEKSIPVLLKAKRQEKGLTLQQLADRSELSPAFLSQAERGKAIPSIVSLLQLAEALETDINYFLTPPKTTDLVRRAEDPLIIDLDSPVTYHRLDGLVRNKQMNALLMHIPANSESPKVHRSEGEDFFYVLDGEIDIDVGDERYQLGPGDCIHINSQIDHNMINKTDGTVRMLWVGTPVLFKE